MKEAIIHKKIIKINNVWFYTGSDELIKSDLVNYMGIKQAFDIKGSIIKKQKSLITDISLPIEELYANIGKNYRYEVRRAKSENLVVKYFKEISDDLLNEFEFHYNKMFEKKNLSTKLNREYLKAYFYNKMALMSIVYKDETPLVFHVYIVDEDKSRLLYSCSDCREEEIDKNLIGRANKFLHIADYYILKKEGVLSYDWGGIMSFDNPTGIDKLKMNLAGNYKEVEYYNQTIAVTIFGKIALILIKINNRIKRYFNKGNNK